MEKAIKRYWPVFVVPTLAAFLIGFVWPFLQGLYLSFCKFDGGRFPSLLLVYRALYSGVHHLY